MDICVLNPFFHPHLGGTEKVILEVYKRLAKKHNICVITGSSKTTHRESISYVEGIKVVRLKSHYVTVPGAPLPFLVMDRIRSHIKSERSDVYHINNRYQYHIDVVNAIKGIDKKLAITIHNSLPRNITGFLDATGLLYDVAWGRTLMGYADLITGVSTNTIETTVPKRHRHKAHVVYNGVDYRKYRPIRKSDPLVERVMQGFPLEGQIIMNNARLVPQKGQLYLIKAFERLLREEYDANLLIVGKGPMMERFASMAERHGIAGRMRIIPEISDGELPYYYNASDMFVLPSTYEPAGLVLLESLATETPTIASRVGGIPEMMGNCGFYIKPKSVESTYRRVLHLLNNPQEARQKAAEGRKLMVREHDWDRIAKQYEGLFLGLLKG